MSRRCENGPNKSVCTGHDSENWSDLLPCQPLVFSFSLPREGNPSCFFDGAGPLNFLLPPVPSTPPPSQPCETFAEGSPFPYQVILSSFPAPQLPQCSNEDSDINTTHRTAPLSMHHYTITHHTETSRLVMHLLKYFILTVLLSTEINEIRSTLKIIFISKSFKFDLTKKELLWAVSFLWWEEGGAIRFRLVSVGWHVCNKTP